MKIFWKPFLCALVATVYIVFIVLAIQTLGSVLPEETILIPIMMLSLFVFSAAIMGFLFLYEPFNLYMENRKREAVVFFGQVVGIFAGFIVMFLIFLFLK